MYWLSSTRVMLHIHTKWRCHLTILHYLLNPGPRSVLNFYQSWYISVLPDCHFDMKKSFFLKKYISFYYYAISIQYCFWQTDSLFWSSDVTHAIPPTPSDHPAPYTIFTDHPCALSSLSSFEVSLPLSRSGRAPQDVVVPTNQ